MKTAYLLCLFLGLCLHVSAQQGKVKQPARPSGTYLLARVIQEDGTLGESDVHGEIRFEQTGNQVFVYFGCNRITASFTDAPGWKCKTDILSSTRMACPNAIEDRFRNAFTITNRYTLARDTLTLFHDGDVTMIMVKQQPAKRGAPEDAQGSFRLYRIREGKKLAGGNFRNSLIRIDGRQLNANVGCNGISGEWITDGQRIQPLRLGMTEMYCEEVDRLERLFVGHLEKLNRWRWKNGRLELLKDEQVLLVLIRSTK